MSIGKHTIANLGGVFIPMMIGLITVPLYLKFIGVERYGLLAIIWALLGYFSFLDFGFGRAVTQRMASLTSLTDVERSNLLWTALITTFFLGIAGSILLWYCADYLLTYAVDISESNRNEAVNSIKWLLLALPFLLAATVLGGALQARERFIELNIILIVGGALGQIVPLIFAASGYVELHILVPVTLAVRLIVVVLNYYECKKYIPLIGKPVVDPVHLRPMITYGGWISVMSFLAPLLVTVDRMIIGTLSGAKAVAYYTVPYDLVVKTMRISSSVSNAIFPRLASEDSNSSRELAIRATETLIAVMTPIIIAGVIILQPFLTFWVGSEFAINSEGVGEIIMLGVWINAMAIPHHARFLAIKNPKTIAVIYLFEIPIYILMLWYGIVYWGVVGAAIAWCFRVFIDTGLLLNLNGVLRHTFLASTSSLFLVICALSIALFFELSLFLKILFAISFFAISVYKDKALLYEILKRVLPRQ